MTSILKVSEIQDPTNSNTALTINSDGSVNMAKQPRFFGGKVGNQTLSRGVTTKITVFTSNEIDTHSAFDGTTFTVPVAGDYYIFASLYHDMTPAGNDGENMVTMIYVNGSEVTRSSFRNNSTRDIDNIVVTAQTMRSLSVNDTVEVYAYQADSSGDNAQILASSGTQFGGYMLG